MKGLRRRNGDIPFPKCSVRLGKDLIYEGIETLSPEFLFYAPHRLLGKDLIYEGIETDVVFQFGWRHFILGKDLIYEGIETGYVGHFNCIAHDFLEKT